MIVCFAKKINYNFANTSAVHVRYLQN